LRGRGLALAVDSVCCGGAKVVCKTPWGLGHNRNRLFAAACEGARRVKWGRSTGINEEPGVLDCGLPNYRSPSLDAEKIVPLRSRNARGSGRRVRGPFDVDHARSRSGPAGVSGATHAGRVGVCASIFAVFFLVVGCGKAGEQQDRQQEQGTINRRAALNLHKHLIRNEIQMTTASKS